MAQRSGERAQSPAEGREHALRLIAECKESQAEELDLSRLQLTELPEELLELGWLKRLSLRDNRARDPALSPRLDRIMGLETLPSSFGAAFPQLEVLDLSQNWLDAKAAAQIAQLQQLQQLMLNFNRIGDEGLAELTALQSLTVLSVNSNNLTHNSAEKLSAFSQLRRLHLADECGDAITFDILALQHLTELRLSYCQITDLGAEILAESQSITKLVLQGSFIEGAGAAQIAKMKQLEELDLSQNAVGNSGLNDLTTLKELRRFDISFNRITSCIADKVITLPHITSLGLSGCKISDSGAKQLAQLKKLKHLTLERNKVGDEGMRALADMPSLESLEITFNAPRTIPKRIVADNNCLPALRAYFANLDAGTPTTLRNVKLMILGNGQIGKTQLRRALCGRPYDESVKTTHGVEIEATTLPRETVWRRLRRSVLGGDAPVPLKIWDFGGQDIYLGTHALFLGSHAIFLILWSPDTEPTAAATHEIDGEAYDNYPLDYWVRYVRQIAGNRAPALLIQSRADRPDDRAEPPIDFANTLEMKDNFAPPRVAFSAKNRRGVAELEEGLRDAVDWLRKQQGEFHIGEGWAAVKQELEARHRADRARAPQNRRWRRLTIREFVDLCRQSGRIDQEADARVLLDFLHHIGAVYHQPGQFDDYILLDQQWALDAIYAVFDRSCGVHKLLRDGLGGRFTREWLGGAVWDRLGFSAEEQELFLAMMASCDICFKARAASRGQPAEYLAPELLPQRADPIAALGDRWDPSAPIEKIHFAFTQLPKPLFRGVMAAIGRRAGEHAIYWRDGLYLYDAATGARALVREIHLRDDPALRDDEVPYAGQIRIETQHGDREALVEALAEIVRLQLERLGIQAPGGRPPQQHMRSARQPIETLRITPEPQATERCFISYKHPTRPGDDDPRETWFLRVEARLRMIGLAPVSDRTHLKYGGDIDEFMSMATGLPKAVIVLSDGYLRSADCMFELHRLYLRSKMLTTGLGEIARVAVLPDADIWSDDARAQIQRYWMARRDRTAAEMSALLSQGESVSGIEPDFARYRDFADHAAEMLRAVSRLVCYRTYQELDALDF
ncbi:MAG: hypothetical protein MRY74_15980 [Neomegalonema sp.]|nr:hypothetical protein [Neomegalonema sp.]